MSDDDNALKDLDLSAWDVPAPETSADELADSVIARVGGTEVGAAIPVDAPASGRKRALLIAGVAAAVLALVAGSWAIVKGTKHVAPSSGEVIAQKAQSLELDAARADLDTGADVTWSRRGGVVRVEQTGNVAWRVGTDSKLVVDVGPGQGIMTGAALASVEATGASLRVEVTTMNAADAKIAGVVASTAAAVALVTVVVYEGHVKVRDGTTQQTVIVQPGTTYKVMPAPPPLDIVDDLSINDDTPVVGVAPVSADQLPEVRIDAGQDVIIHDMAPPTRVQIDMSKVCRGKADLVVNGVTTQGDTLAFNRGSVTYNVMCDDAEVSNGSVIVLRDSLKNPLPSLPRINPVTADGRTYRISYQTVPAIEVHGGPGTLHMAHGSTEKTYEAKGESVLVPASDLEAGDYRFWFAPDVMSQLTLTQDTSLPILSFDELDWGAKVTIRGKTLQGAKLTVDGNALNNLGRGEFMALLPGNVDTLVIRIEHPFAGLHYAIARANVPSTPSNPVAVTTQSGTLDRGAIQKVMGSLKGKFASCVQANPPAMHSIIKVKVLVQADGRVGNVDVTQGVMAALDQCVKVAVEGTVFPSASQTTAFLYPIVVEPPSRKTPSTCDADALKDAGMEALNLGKYDVALANLEASLACKDDPYVQSLAFLTACNAKDKGKVALYWDKLSGAQQTKFKQACVRNGIDPSSLAAPSAPANCDADAAKDKGMENVNMGQHAAALSQFEASLRCKEDGYVRSLAFMAACNAQNGGKAKEHWQKLTHEQQNKYQMMCTRNGIDPTKWTASASPVAPSNCDADALKDKGMDYINQGMHAAALAQFEASLRCKSDSYVLSLAFMEACNSKNAAKARSYWPKLAPTQRSKYEQICERNGIDVQSSAGSGTSVGGTSSGSGTNPAPPAHCDADALRDKGMEWVNQGQHAAALSKFEESLACKNDSYTLSLAFMSSCLSQNAGKARKYWLTLSDAQQTKYRQMCVRNHIDPAQPASTDDPNADSSAKGYLQITSKPAAKIIIDGVDTGLTTPISGKKLPLTAGKHKVTFQIGDDRYAYPVVIRAGKTETMSKDLR